MIDRLISGAGAVSATVDRFVRSVLPGTSLAAQPASLIAAGLFALVAGGLFVVGLESTGSGTLRTLDPAVIATSDGLGDRVYATISGRLPSTYVETYDDTDADGNQDADEVGTGWDYFLLSAGADDGVMVRSERPPWSIYTFSASGTVVNDPTYVDLDLEYLGDDPSIADLDIDPDRYIDATVAGSGAPHDLSLDLPPDGTSITLDASRLVEFLTACSADPDGDGTCSDDEVDLYDVIVYDPVSRRGVVVLTDESPEYLPAAFTGILHRDARAIAESAAAPGPTLSEFGISLSPIYLLEEGAAPANAAALFAAAAALVVVAAVIAVGALGGYVVFRPGGGSPPAGRSFAPGERLPARVSGRLRAPTGLVHVREAPADVVRFVLEPPLESTMIVERQGLPEGVALGHDELTSMDVGAVITARGGRPALRLGAGTGTILVSFETPEARDRVASELGFELAVGTGPEGDRR